ncbi:MAG: hypothetical protein ACYC7E_21465 [Armatimonadota bacterium]
MQREFAIFVDDGVAGITAALIANHHICLSGKHIRDLSFALVAPIGANNRANTHGTPHMASSVRGVVV